MFIRRKEYEELVNRIKRLEKNNILQSDNFQGLNYEHKDLTRKIECLEKIHNLRKEIEHRIGYDCEIYVCDHNSITFNTDHVKNVTLDELVKFVIDDEPIKREETVKVEYRK